jgi:hypothetical protein
LFLNPLIWWEIITASDYLTNSIVYFVFIALLMFKKPAQSIRENILLTIFGTLVLCSRFNFWVPLPLIVWYLWSKKNFTYLRVLIASFLLNLLIIALCIYLVGPANFSPLHTKHFLAFNLQDVNVLNVIIPLVVLGIITLVIVKRKQIPLAIQFANSLTDRLLLLKIIGLLLFLLSLATALVRQNVFFLTYSTPAIIFLTFSLVPKLISDERFCEKTM